MNEKKRYTNSEIKARMVLFVVKQKEYLAVFVLEKSFCVCLEIRECVFALREGWKRVTV